MPKGTNLTSSEKRSIYDSFVAKNRTIQEVHEILFQSDSSRISLRTLENFKHFLEKATDDDATSWIEGKSREVDHHASLLDAPGTAEEIERLALLRPKMTQQDIATQISTELGDNNHYTRQDIQRWLKRHKISDHLANQKDGLAGEFFFVILIMNALRHSYVKI